MTSDKCPSCASCGMPMEKLEDFSMGNNSNVYCKYCTGKDGKLLPYEIILKMNADFFKESQNLTEEASVQMASNLLQNQPAWKNGGS